MLSASVISAAIEGEALVALPAPSPPEYLSPVAFEKEASLAWEVVHGKPQQANSMCHATLVELLQRAGQMVGLIQG